MWNWTTFDRTKNNKQAIKIRYNRKIHSIDLSKGSLIEAKKFIDKTDIKNVHLYRMNIFNLFFSKKLLRCNYI